MTEIGITSLILIIANIFCSVQGLNDRPSFERYNFQIGKILFNKEYNRLLTSGFFHINSLHLILNLASLCFFSSGVELHLGGAKYLLIYFASLVAGNLFALFIYKNNANFNTSGASGAVTGTIFATIALFPGFEIGFLGLHFPIPGWFYGFLYVLFSIYGIKSKRDNIGHETHLAGGLMGIIMAVLLEPVSFLNNYLPIICITIPSVFFIFIIITRPRFILIDNTFWNQDKENYKVEIIRNTGIVDHQREIDLILEKIHQNGIESLSKLEKEKLDYYSKIIQ